MMDREIKCPIFKATGIKAIKTECNSCPFKDNCLEDVFNDASARAMQIIGDYLHGELDNG